MSLSTETAAERQKKGTLYAIGCYFLWGFFPIYWKLLGAFAAFEILAHRITWSFVFYWGLLAWRRQSPHGWLKLYQNPKSAIALVAAGGFLTGNWFLYIWAVNNGHVLESSLGYFITPLVNVMLGFVFLGERLTRLSWVATALAAIGVLILAFQTQDVPWIALGLAFSFGLYGLIRKQLVADIFEASAAETFLVLIPAVAVMSFYRFGAGAPAAPVDWVLFVASGVVTGLPLIWFSYAAVRLPLSSLGFFQYIAPTLQFLSGVFIFHEPFSLVQLKAFAFIWLGLVVFSWESLRKRRQPPPAPIEL
jgi:chloramphenicol-sensitive protein RarD